MKSIFVLSTVLAAAFAMPDDPMMGGHGHGAAPKGPPKGIKVEKLRSQFSPQNQRVRVTYGIYKLTAFNETKGGHAGMENEGGLFDASNPDAPKPCSDCTLKYAKAFLKYPDGKTANFQNGAYLHHLTGAMKAKGRSDVACPGGTKRIPEGMERMLAIHNDRNETFYGITATDKMGFYISKEDKFDMELILKNEVNIPKEVVFSIEWEFVPGKPAGYSEVKGIWMDVAPCSAMMSDLPIPANKTKFTLSGPSWTSNYDGRLLNTVGHMHDGGVDVLIVKNGKTVCTSKAEYDTKPEYVTGPEAVKNGATKMSHISVYTPCINIGEIKKGDTLSLTTSYDLDKWAPGLNKLGAHSDVMGVALLFMEVKPQK